MSQNKNNNIKPFIEYPETKHFEDSKSVLFANKIKEIDIHGTIKLHGTNFSIVFDIPSSGWYFQKRTGILEYYSNFFDFQKVMGIGDREKTNRLQAFLNSFVSQFSDKKQLSKVVFFGELVGEEIQKKVALADLTKRFVIFDVVKIHKDSVDDESKWQWINGNELKGQFNSSQKFEDIYCIENFPTWDLKMDITDQVAMSELQNKLQQITEEVEKECPFSKAFGVSGIGEGVVWKHGRFRFKVKGAEHTTSKVKSLKTVDIEKIANLKTKAEIADAICTEARLKQGLQYLVENPSTNEIKTFVEWIIKDTIKEEGEFIKSRNLDESEIKKILGQKAATFYRLNK